MRSGAKQGPALELGVFGHFAVKRRPVGYKVFNLSAQTVNIVGGLGPNDKKQYLEMLAKLGDWGVAPGLVDRAPSSDVLYTEQYINATHPIPSHLDEGTFYAGALPVIISVAQHGGAQSEGFENYFEHQRQHALNLLGNDEKNELGRKVREFIERTVLNDNRPSFLSITISHGDLTEKNLFILGSGPVAIDWETVSRRSLLYDVYAHFISLLVRFVDNSTDTQIVIKALETAKRATLERLAGKCPGLAIEIGQQRSYPEAYMKLFFVELIVTRLRYFVAPIKDHSQSEEYRKRLAQVVQYIEAFQQLNFVRT